MKRVFGMAIVIATALACSGGGTATDPTLLTDPIAQNVTISQITILQALEIPVMANGDIAVRGGMDASIPPQPYTYPLIAQRDSILRVYVTPESGFSTHALTARARIVTPTPTGTQAQVFQGTGTISTPSQQFDLASTINIPIPGLALERGSSITVVVNDKTGDSASTPSSSARWPTDGSMRGTKSCWCVLTSESKTVRFSPAVIAVFFAISSASAQTRGENPREVFDRTRGASGRPGPTAGRGSIAPDPTVR